MEVLPDESVSQVFPLIPKLIIVLALLVAYDSTNQGNSADWKPTADHDRMRQTYQVHT
jgi:hypothetical protein